MKILDGLKLAKKITQNLKRRVQKLKKNGVCPTLHIYLVGNNPASLTYVNMKQKKAEEIGAKCVIKKFPASIGAKEVIYQINKDGMNANCHGIIVQLPLPKQLDPNELLQVVDVEKDVDGLTYINQWRLLAGVKEGLLPATPKGILTLLKANKILIEGKKVVVIGRSRLVGMPTALLMLRENATVTICHSRTRNLAKETKQADILIVAAGNPKMIDKKFVKKNAVVVDVGISRTSDKVIGDVDFDSVRKMAKSVSPVPGGVGPMTVVSLFENLIEAAEGNSQKSIKS